MNRTARVWTGIAAVSGLLSVAVGAFAAHGASDLQAKEWLRLGAQYQMVHALAVMAAVILAAQGLGRGRVAPGLFVCGTVLFSGSLYAMAFGAPRWFGAITPLGGVAFLAGWAVIAWSAFRKDQTTA